MTLAELLKYLEQRKRQHEYRCIEIRSAYRNREMTSFYDRLEVSQQIAKYRAAIELIEDILFLTTDERN